MMQMGNPSLLLTLKHLSKSNKRDMKLDWITKQDFVTIRSYIKFMHMIGTMNLACCIVIIKI